MTSRLSAIHVNHGLQAAADDWQLHCEAFCRALEIDCHSYPVDATATGGRRPRAASGSRGVASVVLRLDDLATAVGAASGARTVAQGRLSA